MTTARLAAEREQRRARIQRETHEQRQDRLTQRVKRRQQETHEQRNTRLRVSQTALRVR